MLKTIKYFAFYLTVLLALICAPQSIFAQTSGRSLAEFSSNLSDASTLSADRQMSSTAANVLDLLKRLDLVGAGNSVKDALETNSENSYLHFMRGLTHHLRARQGEGGEAEIAVASYKKALQIDLQNLIAMEFLALSYMDSKKYALAVEQFSGVLSVEPKRIVSIYGLMVTSYMTGDAVTACVMADRIWSQAGEHHEGFVRSSALVYASCGEDNKAYGMKIIFDRLNRQPSEFSRLALRLDQWREFHKKHVQIMDLDALDGAGVSGSRAAANIIPLRVSEGFSRASLVLSDGFSHASVIQKTKLVESSAQDPGAQVQAAQEYFVEPSLKMRSLRIALSDLRSSGFAGEFKRADVDFEPWDSSLSTAKNINIALQLF